MKKDDKKADNRIDQKEYEAAFIPDWKLLAKMVEIAKGPERTMAQFAKDCGKSPATFSRIMHGRNEKRLSEQLLRDIANNACEPDIVDFEALMRANGMVPKNGKGQTENVRTYLSDKFDQRNQISNQVRRIIGDELDARGVMSRFAGSIHMFMLDPKSQYGISCRSSFSAKLLLDDGLENQIQDQIKYENQDKVQDQNKNIQYWSFLVIFHEMTQEEVEGIQKENVGRHLRSVYTYGSGIFLRDEWEPETLKGVKNSFIFTDPIYFEFVVNNMPDIKVNTDISLILVDTEKNKVVREVSFPRKDGEIHPSIFEMKVVDDPSGSDGDDDGLYSDEENI